MTKIKGVQVENFRSIIDTGKIPINEDKISIILGLNGAGKTSLIEALNSMNSKDGIKESDLPNYNTKKKVKISFYLSEIDNNDKDLLQNYIQINDELKLTIQNYLKGEKNYLLNDKTLKEILLSKKLEIINSEFVKKHNTKNQINQNQPIDHILQSINNIEKQLKDDEKTKNKDKFEQIKSNLNKMIQFEKFPGKLVPTIIEFNPTVWNLNNKYNYKNMNDTVKKILNKMGINISEFTNASDIDRKSMLRGRDVSFENELRDKWLGGDKLLKLYAEQTSLEIHIIDNPEKSDVHTRPEDRSGGEQWTLKFYLFMMFNNYKSSNKPVMVVIDEPSYNLHPIGQREVCNLIDAEINKNENLYFLYSTHSPYMVPPNKLKRITRLEKKNIEEGTKAKPFDEMALLNFRPEKKLEQLDTNLYRDMTPDIIEGLFSRMVILCEGYSEEKTLYGWFSYYNEKNADSAVDIIVQGVKIISVGSKDELRKIGSFFRIFNIPTYYIFDNDVTGDQDKMRTSKEKNKKLTFFINGNEDDDPEGKNEGYFAFKPDFESVFKNYKYVKQLDSDFLHFKVSDDGDIKFKGGSKPTFHIRILKKIIDSNWEIPNKIRELIKHLYSKIRT